MNKSYGYMEVYSDILDSVSSGAKGREEIFAFIAKRAGLTEKDIADTSVNGRLNTLRMRGGALINEMLKKNILAENAHGKYYALTDKPIALRAERCESEVLKILSKKPMSKEKIRRHLVSYFGTARTKTKRDDNKLYSFIVETLKRLTDNGIIAFDGGTYSIPEARFATVDDMQKMSKLKADFLTLLHSRGGEFFEYYFMNLLSRYLEKHGKTVTQCNVTGGSDDGGIDGIAKTVDSLGFRETVMVQTKNRTDYTTEIDVRGFYGAVCAGRGSRGIYAITSRFHPNAEKFINELDDCIGIDGERIFEMAKEVEYGIRKDGERLLIDIEII